MAKWVVTFRYKPNPYTTDNCIHYDTFDCKREHVEPILRRFVRHGEYLEILEIVSSKVWDRRILKERQKKEGREGEQNG